jgi:hypothetical protein
LRGCAAHLSRKSRVDGAKGSRKEGQEETEGKENINKKTRIVKTKLNPPTKKNPSSFDLC